MTLEVPTQDLGDPVKIAVLPDPVQQRRSGDLRLLWIELPGVEVHDERRARIPAIPMRDRAPDHGSGKLAEVVARPDRDERPADTDRRDRELPQRSLTEVLPVREPFGEARR